MVPSALAVLLLPLGASGADSGEAVAVSVEWSGVEERIIARCELRTLHSVLYQCLLDSRYALAPADDEAAIRLTIRSEDSAILVRTSRSKLVEERRVRVPRRCDGTIALDICAAATAALDAIPREPPPTPEVAPAAPAPVTEKSLATPPSAPAEAPSLWSFEIVAGADVPGSRFVGPMAGVRLRRRLPHRLSLAGRIRATLIPYDGRASAEVSLDAHADWQPFAVVPALRVGVGLAGVYHIFAGGEVTGGHADLHVLVPIRFHPDGWIVGVEVSPYVRLQPVGHVVEDRTFYSSEYVGVVASVVVQVF